jgi:hypothetical protein
VAVIRPIDGERLGAIFGRDRAVHVAIASGRIADGLLVDAGRLAGVVGRPDGLASRATARTTQRDQAGR